jgi:hypothetical protein
MLSPILCEVSVELVSFIKNCLSFKELLRLEVFVGLKIWIAMFWGYITMYSGRLLSKFWKILHLQRRYPRQ